MVQRQRADAATPRPENGWAVTQRQGQQLDRGQLVSGTSITKPHIAKRWYLIYRLNAVACLMVIRRPKGTEIAGMVMSPSAAPAPRHPAAHTPWRWAAPLAEAQGAPKNQRPSRTAPDGRRAATDPGAWHSAFSRLPERLAIFSVPLAQASPLRPRTDSSPLSATKNRRTNNETS